MNYLVKFSNILTLIGYLDATDLRYSIRSIRCVPYRARSLKKKNLFKNGIMNLVYFSLLIPVLIHRVHQFIFEV